MAVKMNAGRRIWVDGFPVHCDLNVTDVSRRQEVLDATRFCSSGRRRLAGLQDFSITMAGLYNVSTGSANYDRPTSQQIEPAAFNRLVQKSSAIVLLADSTVAGAACYIGVGCGAEVNLSGSVGSILGITAVAQGNGPLVSGRILEYGNLSTAGFTANIIDLVPISRGSLLGLSTKARLHASVHIFGSTGAANVAKRISIQASSDIGFGEPLIANSSLFVWKVPNIDNTTSPGTAKYATTKISSTKIRYVRITQKSSAGSTKAFFKMAIAVGVSQK